MLTTIARAFCRGLLYPRYLIVIVMMFATTTARAALLIENSGTGGTLFGAEVSDANTLGSKFTVGAQPLLMTGLGFFDNGLDGLLSPVEVGVWNTSTTTQVAAATVPAGTGPTLINDYRFVTLPNSIILAANTSYTIGYRSPGPGPGELQDGRDRTGMAIDSAMTIPGGGFGLRHSFDTEPFSTDFATQMPAMNLGDTVPLLGPNLQFSTTVPEPGSLCVVAIAAALLSRRQRGA